MINGEYLLFSPFHFLCVLHPSFFLSHLMSGHLSIGLDLHKQVDIG